MKTPVRAVIAQRFACPAERVFDAWLDPEWIGRWMYGPAERIVRLGLEPRAGGKFSFVVNRRGEEVDHAGEYLELDRPGLLVFTWGTRAGRPASSRVVVEIFPDADGCELTLTHVMATDSTASAEMAAGDWRLMLEALAGALAETNTLTLNAK